MRLNVLLLSDTVHGVAEYQEQQSIGLLVDMCFLCICPVAMKLGVSLAITVKTCIRHQEAQEQANKGGGMTSHSLFRKTRVSELSLTRSDI